MKKFDKLQKIIIKYKLYIICFIIILLSIISVIIQMTEKKQNTLKNNDKFDEKNNMIGVYITGRVNNPGVYYLKYGARLYELLDLCGGISENADISSINLAKKLNDSDMITINEKKEEKEEFDDVDSSNFENSKININKASKDELKSLEGIGEQTAQKIIEYRKQNTFSEIEDILNVDGIGTSKFEKIKDDICV